MLNWGYERSRHQTRSQRGCDWAYSYGMNEETTFRESAVVEGRSAMLWKLEGHPFRKGSSAKRGDMRLREPGCRYLIIHATNYPSRDWASAASCAEDKAAAATHENSIQRVPSSVNRVGAQLSSQLLADQANESITRLIGGCFLFFTLIQCFGGHPAPAQPLFPSVRCRECENRDMREATSLVITSTWFDAMGEAGRNSAAKASIFTF